MENIDLIRVTTNELDRLQEISIQTFTESYAAVNTGENMMAYVKDGFSAEKLRAELREETTEFYFAVLGDKLIGYLKANFKQPDTAVEKDEALEIERIYVLKEFQGKGIGQLLFEKAMALAAQKGANYVWLGVWDQNEGAQRFYQRNGFVEFDQHTFTLGEEIQNDLLMRKSL